MENIEKWLANRNTFVSYKKPFENQLKCLLQRNNHLHLHDGNTAGFVFYPFDFKEKKIVFPYSMCDEFEIQLNESEIITDETSLESSAQNPFEKEKHLSLVQNAVQFIQHGNAQKVVISRKKTIATNKISPIDIFRKLTSHYPEAFVYLWQHPLIGTWVGATPERLLTSHHKSVTTMALAGTQIYKENLIWQSKELEEQALVTQYIKEKLTPLVVLDKTEKAHTKKAGHLAHLCTQISGQLREHSTLQDVINSLHPTPAVCGTPLQPAFEFILNNEGYSRKYYTGFLGEFTAEHCELFVNLRCAEISDNQANIYIGGGITKDSIPENEWQETVNKSMVLGQFF